MGNLTIVNKSIINIIVTGLGDAYSLNKPNTLTISPGSSKSATYTPFPEIYDLKFSISPNLPPIRLGIFAGENDPFPIIINNQYATFSRDKVQFNLGRGTYYVKDFSLKKYLFNSKLTFPIYISTKVDNDHQIAILVP